MYLYYLLRSESHTKYELVLGFIGYPWYYSIQLQKRCK